MSTSASVRCLGANPTILMYMVVGTATTKIHSSRGMEIAARWRHMVEGLEVGAEKRREIGGGGTKYF